MKKLIAATAGAAMAASAVAVGVASIPTAAARSACPANPLTFAVEPYDTAAALQKAYASLAGDLSQKLGCKVQLVVSNSYVAEIDAMASGHV